MPKRLVSRVARWTCFYLKPDEAYKVRWASIGDRSESEDLRGRIQRNTEI
jgi:hypothetical protein